MPELRSQVQKHYARKRIVENAFEALKTAGIDPKKVTVTDLAPLDQMHLRGIEATREIAKRAGLKKGVRVLDVGSGLGGPARTLAAEFGVQVVGVDITPEYVAAANEFAKRLGLTDRVEFREGDAQDLPFDEQSFDVVTSMTAFMNIPDKTAAYSEVRRVLKPGGRLIQLETLQGPNGTPHFPTLWAADPAYSFLETPEQIQGRLETAGLKVTKWEHDDKASMAWIKQMEAAMQRQGPTALGPHVIHGPEIVTRMQNAARSLAEGRVTVAFIEAQVPKA